MVAGEHLTGPRYFGASMAISGALHAAAREAYGRFRERGWHQDFFATVVVSVTAAHAGINEIWDVFSLRHQPDGELPPPQTARNTWRDGIRLITGSPIDENSQLWRDFEAVVNLRNRIIHFEWGGEEPDLASYFYGRRLAQNGGPWMHAVTTLGVAALAVNVAVDLFTHLRTNSPWPLDIRWDGWREDWLQVPCGQPLPA